MGGPALTITSQEHLPFLEIDIPLSSRRALDIKEKAGRSSSETNGSGIYEVTIPDIGQLLPSYKKSDLDQGELGFRAAEVQLLIIALSRSWRRRRLHHPGTWQTLGLTQDERQVSETELAALRPTLTLANSRRLSLEVPICFPISPPLPFDLPQEHYPSSTGTQSLKFKSGEGNSLSVEAKVSLHLHSSGLQARKLTSCSHGNSSLTAHSPTAAIPSPTPSSSHPPLLPPSPSSPPKTAPRASSSPSLYPARSSPSRSKTRASVKLAFVGRA